MSDSVRAGLDTLAQHVAEQVAEVKPHLRGWLHLATFPLSMVAGVVLVWLSPTTTTRLATAVFAVSSSLLFVPPLGIVQCSQAVEQILNARWRASLLSS